MATNPNDPFNLEGLGLSSDNLPPELGGEVLKNLDTILSRQENMQADRLLNQQEERGLFRSGQTETELRDQVLTPGIETRRKALLDIVGGGVNQAREERLGTLDFSRQKEFQALAFEQKMKELEQQAANQQALLRLQADLGIGMPQERLGFWENLGGSFASGFGSSLGDRLGKQGAGK